MRLVWTYTPRKQRRIQGPKRLSISHISNRHGIFLGTYVCFNPFVKTLSCCSVFLLFIVPFFRVLLCGDGFFCGVMPCISGRVEHSFGSHGGSGKVEETV